jgi:chromosome segregation ATPase
MLRAFGDDRDPSRDPSLSTIAGAALLLLQKAEQSLASLAGAAAGGPQNGLAVTVGLDPQLHKDVVSQLEALTSTVSTEQHDLASMQKQLTEFRSATHAWQAETERHVARLEEHFGHLRARQDSFMSGATELTETVQTIRRDHGRFTEELAAFSQRIEPLEHRKKGGS